MNVFLTGATGFVGTAIIPELLAAGHAVTGLARSDEGAAKLEAAGARAHRGDLHDLESLLSAVRVADGVIHTGFIHDFANFAESAKTDTAAIMAMGRELEGSGRPLVITSGIGILPSGVVSTEATRPDGSNHVSPRLPSELAIDELAGRGVRASVVRLPPSVHDRGDHGFVPTIISTARAKGASVFVGEGLNRWPAVHRSDAARLFRLALESGTAGARYHAIGDEGIPFREIAALIATRLGVPLVSRTREEAAAHFGWIGFFTAIDVPATALITKRELSWEANGPGLLEDLETGDYFG